jgi:hypothetical protein
MLEPSSCYKAAEALGFDSLLSSIGQCHVGNGMLNPDKGVLFIVTGAHYTAAACDAARSVRETNPWLGIGIFTDQQVKDPLFDFISRIEGAASRRKHDYVGRSPFRETLYLDSDVRVTSDLSDLFRVLERFELAGAHVRYRSSPKRLKKHNLDLPQAFPQMNCGVMLYKKCPNVDALFSIWQELYLEGGFTRDQIPFREALWNSNVKLYILGPEYNKRNIPLPFGKEPLPIILHIHAFHSPSLMKRLALHVCLWPTRLRLRRAAREKHRAEQTPPVSSSSSRNPV